jgi:hypothetical protein
MGAVLFQVQDGLEKLFAILVKLSVDQKEAIV